ncbi:LysR substrate-binding domain-containing protein [Klebsiella pneumoniae]|uniref:LysR substrate-binding domain-containing protein n=1 Tax=Klebsiella pneumoniae TaxID=573 RepID=UPI001D0DF091|nr:LysR substrate-binding domain-containing protein [Klebsiella pneumoniae]MCK1062786.1 LysR substrate-binding domain-containing protein [Klebsiella pneumoniae]MCK1110260.1 LysR substrate-binding domain-containing protein [Klebsiella pneumoniae]MCL8334641.1 LysR substrate-binding domain-containing protein [Klebsiella pneumoniae]MCW9187055.1 LysR substrate-binding domain-containing protein [Klebsiella pneumoniae]MDW1424259.1 LysR substrate-binding domain-containing protein [Klebsiella pneumonia
MATDFRSGGNRWVCRCVADMEDAENSLSSAAMTPRGRLRVDVPSPLTRLILVPALPAFHARYPDIQIDMGVSDRGVDLIGDNVDCVLRGGQITDQSLIARHVGDLQIGVYVAPSYVERLGAPAHPRELQNTDHCIVGFLSSRTSKIDPLVLCSENERIEITGNYVLAVDDGNAYHEAGLVGLGVIALPNYMAAAHQAVGALIPLFTQWRISPMPLYLAFPPNRHVNAKLRVFIDWIVEVMLQHVPIANNQ